jgi:hypothetical protein
LLDSDVIFGTTFKVQVEIELSFWDIQQYEWNRIQGKNVLKNWWVDGGYRSREATVTVDRNRLYAISVIKGFPSGELYRAEWIGDNPAAKSRTNVLHIPYRGMMIRFNGQDVLRISTICSNGIRVAVKDTLRTRTRMCKMCDKAQARMEAGVHRS